MTTPGGVPNLPTGALTLDTLVGKLHDMSPSAMRGRGAARVPAIFDSSMGGNPMSDYSFLGLMMQLWGGFSSAIANADPADITGPDDLPGLLVTFIEDLPIVGEFVTLMKEVINGTFDIGDVVTAIENSFNTLGSMLGLPSPLFDVDAMVDWFSQNFPLVSGLIDAVLGGLDRVPLSAIVGGASNYLANPHFTSGALSAVADWSIDTTGTHSTGVEGAGSVSVTADGYEHSLYSNRMGVSVGQEVPMSVWVDWSELASAGSPIRLYAVPFDAADAELPWVLLDSITSPPGNAPDWTQLVGEYTVASGVVEVSMLLHVDATAITGTVRFSDAVLDKDIVGDIAPLEWVEELVPSLNGLEQYTQDLVDAGIGVVTGIFGSGGTVAEWIDEVTSWFDDTQATAGQASDALAQGVGVAQSMFNTWFGVSTATGATSEVAQTFSAVRASVAGGYTLQTFTANNAAWAPPSSLRTAAEAYAVGIGGGGKGRSGTSSTGGAGGTSGGFVSVKIDPSTLASTLEVTIGAAASTAGANGGLTRIKSGSTTLVESRPGVGSMSAAVGHVASSSLPGNGGAGGDVVGSSGTAGVAGDLSATATGGAAGSGATGPIGATAGSGGAGGNGVYTNVPLCGGGGGGGGGGAYTGSALGVGHGGNGGAGGFPGGASGGGGAGSGGAGDDPGSPGTPGNGMAALLWR